MRTRYVAAACLVVAGGCIAALVAQDALARIGVKESDAQRDMVYSFVVHGSANPYSVRAPFKAALPGGRAAFAKGLAEWARSYTESAAFKTRYDRDRASAAPTPPKAKNVDEELARQKAEQKKSLEDARKNLAQMPAEMRAQMEATFKQMEAEQAKRDADPKYAALMRQMVEMQNVEDQKRFDQSLARYNQQYPADPRVLVAARLRQFLEVSKDVDFGAALVSGPDKKQRFANPAYESKPAEWKLCFRAGKDATSAAREAAQAWLAALGK